MKWARYMNGQLVEVVTQNPADLFVAEIAAQFMVVDDEVTVPTRPKPTPSVQVAPVPPKVSVIEYKMLFTSAERIAVKASTDPVIIDLQELMNDPRTVNVDLSLKSISDTLDYMTYLGLIAPGRKAEILTGEIQ